MAKTVHHAIMEIGSLTVKRAGVKFRVLGKEGKKSPQSGQGQIGLLTVSNGSVLWNEGYDADGNQYRVPWEDFNLIMKKSKSVLKAIKAGKI